MKRLVGLLVICFFLGNIAVVAQKVKADNKNVVVETENDKIAQDIRCMIYKKSFTIDVQWAYPMTGAPVALTSQYTLKMAGDTICSYLPYYGRAYSLPMGGGKGLIFEGKISSCIITYPKEDHAKIKLVVSNDEDTYIYWIDVYTNGSANINVTSNKRDPINFRGSIDLNTPNLKSSSKS